MRKILGLAVAATVLALLGVAIARQVVRSLSTPPPTAGTEKVSAQLQGYRRLCDAKELTAQGRHAEAAPQFEQLSRELAGSAHGWDAEIFAAAAQGHLGQHEAGLARLQRAIRECPHAELIPFARMAVAEVHSLAGKPELGVQLLEELIRDHAEKSQRVCAEALLALTGLHSRHDQLGLVRADLLRIVADFPGDEDSLRKAAERQLAALDELISQRQQTVVAEIANDKNIRRIDEWPGGDSTWQPDARHLVSRTLRVPPDAMLRMDPGTEVRFATAGGLHVEGRLEIAGTPEQPVVLTTIGGNPSRDWWAGISLASTGSITLRQCRIVGADVGVEAAEGGQAVLEHCTFDHCSRGVQVARAARLQMSDCIMVGSYVTGVRCGPASLLEMDRCRITGTASHGAVYQDAAPDCLLRQSVIEDAGGNGLLLRASSPTIELCRISKSRAHGVRCAGGGSPIIRQTEISGNGGIGIWLEERWDALLADNHIAGNRGGGVHAETRSRGRIERNGIESNEGFGLKLGLDCRPILAGNGFLNNQSVGLWLLQAAVPQQFENNRFEGNGEVAIRNEGSETLEAGHNWWGTTDETAISRAIQDHEDNPAWGEVQFRPLLTAPPASTPTTAPADDPVSDRGSPYLGV